MEHINALKGTLAAVGAALTALWGWFGWLIIAWIGAMVLDYATGTAAALRSGQWSSQTAREGLWHKAGCVAAVAVAGLLDGVIGHLIGNLPSMALPFSYTVFLCPLVVVWYILTEVGSIIENAGAMGAPLPTWLQNAIAALKDGVDGAGDTLMK